MAPTITDNTKRALRQRLEARRRDRWPQLTEITIRYRGRFAYLDGTTTNGDTLALCRLRHVGALDMWGFAIYLATKNRYEDSFLPTGRPTGTPEDALDCACGLYLNDPTAWTTDSPTNL